MLLNRNRSIVKIADLGHSKIVKKEYELNSNTYKIYSAGAILIQSPEQRAGRANGKKNDIWLFGLLMVYMFHGYEVFGNFMNRCQRENFPKLSSYEQPNLNEFLSTIFVPENQRDNADTLLYKLEGYIRISAGERVRIRVRGIS